MHLCETDRGIIDKCIYTSYWPIINLSTIKEILCKLKWVDTYHVKKNTLLALFGNNKLPNSKIYDYVLKYGKKISRIYRLNTYILTDYDNYCLLRIEYLCLPL